MEFRYLNMKDEVIKVGDQIKTDAGFVGQIYELEHRLGHNKLVYLYKPHRL